MTFWALTVGGVFFFFAIYAANQPCMQRTCALSTLTKARWWLSRIILWKHTIEQIYWWQISTILVYSFHKNLDNYWCFFQVNDPHWSIIWNSCLVVSGSWHGSIRLLPTKRMWPNTGKLSDQLQPGICIISCNKWNNKKYAWSMSTLSHERSTTFLADHTLFRNGSVMLSWSSRRLFCLPLQWISKVWYVIFTQVSKLYNTCWNNHTQISFITRHSSLSSSINSMTAVVWEDILKGHFDQVTEERKTIYAKILCK